MTATDVITEVAEGALRGSLEGSLSVFKGIAYAAAPVGRLRWRAPEPAAAWSGIRDVRAFGGRCVQEADLGIFSRSGGVEDCLYLNIYAPADAMRNNGRLPVLVWIHGGSYWVGSSCDYDGSHLAIEGNAVVVSINYRLGLLGFFAHPAFAAEGTPCGNFGIMDQEAALRWIRRNIAAFGGDPDNVTIFGESSGGASVFAHILSPGSAGLFQHAIPMSGGSVALRYPAFGAPKPLEIAYQMGERFAEAMGCADGDLSALRSLPIETIMQSRQAYWHNQIIIDGVTVPDHPADLLRSGKFNDVTIASGYTRHEGTFFAALMEQAAGAPMDLPDFEAAMNNYYGPDLAGAVIKAYPADAFGTPAQAYAAAVTSSLFACTAGALHAILAPQARLYVYEFADETAPSYIGSASFPLGAAHSFELQYLFPGFNGDGSHAVALDEGQARLSHRMIALFSSLHKAGAAEWDWPRYDPAKNNVLVLAQPELHVVEGECARRLRQEFWDRTGLY